MTKFISIFPGLILATLTSVHFGLVTSGQDVGDVTPKPRFKTPEGFFVEEVLAPEISGSVVNMTFDSKGRLVLSSEKGPVYIVFDNDKDGRPETLQAFTDQVTNCQGLKFDGDDLLAVGDGPSGTAFYRVIDRNGDARGDEVVTIGRFTARMGEHGPHAVFFGPEGHLYLVLGNHTGIVATPDPFSPHQGYIEGHLLPGYADPRGHARNIRAPGAIIVRLDARATRWQIVAGGFRNMYDAAFNLRGELFTFDSDMEWEINMPWYRPVRTHHVVPGGEYGWRTGSAKFPPYYPDSLPALTDLGRGSPSGVEFYQSDAYPREYYDSFLSGDWSRGRILVGFLEKSGATYKERLEEFVTGEPLNVTDLEVGPDGYLYFSKGGRSTEGGIYRVVYSPELPRSPAPLRLSPLDTAIMQPQPRSSWGRANLARIQKEMGKEWGKKLLKVVDDERAGPERRVRALELLQVYGPVPDERLLISLGQDPSWEVQAASSYYLGLHKTESARRELVRRLKDGDDFVQRRSCEALIRTEIHSGMNPSFSPVEDIFPLLGESDRLVRYAAREVLRRTNRNLWRDEALRLNDYPQVTEALLTLVQTVRGTNDVEYLLDRELELLRKNPADSDLLPLLRVIHLTMIHDQRVDYSKAYREMGELLLKRFPTRERFLNREIAQTLARLQTPGALQEILSELEGSKGDREQQIHYAYCLRVIRSGWKPIHQEAFIRWFETTQEERWRGGASFVGFLENIWNDFLEHVPPEDKQMAMERVPALSPQPVEAGRVVQPAFRRNTDTHGLSIEELAEYLLWDPMSYTGKVEQGRAAFDKASCAKCHILGDVGQEAGPDLTTVGKRFQRKDLIDATLHPSKTISDLWTAVEIETTNGDLLLGVVSREDDESLTLITGTGDRVAVPKSALKNRRPSKTSLMPEGLLDILTLRETVDLFAFLEKGGDYKGNAEKPH